MFSRFLAIVSVLLILGACQSTKDAGKGGEGYPEGVEGFYMRSEGLEPFTPLEGDEAGAKAHDRVFFEFDSSVLSSRSQETLDKQANWLKEHGDVNVTVEGHCDERGTREYNLGLGDRRAQAVRNYLVAAGVTSGRVKTISYGKERPAILGSSETAWEQNRRGVTVLE